MVPVAEGLYYDGDLLKKDWLRNFVAFLVSHSGCPMTRATCHCVSSELEDAWGRNELKGAISIATMRQIAWQK